jgi:hypothetical protein
MLRDRNYFFSELASTVQLLRCWPMWIETTEIITSIIGRQSSEFLASVIDSLANPRYATTLPPFFQHCIADCDITGGVLRSVWFTGSIDLLYPLVFAYHRTPPIRAVLAFICDLDFCADSTESWVIYLVDWLQRLTQTFENKKIAPYLEEAIVASRGDILLRPSLLTWAHLRGADIIALSSRAGECTSGERRCVQYPTTCRCRSIRARIAAWEGLYIRNTDIHA